MSKQPLSAAELMSRATTPDAMKKVRELRARATECRAQAAKATLHNLREDYSRAAEMWDKLAEERLRFFIGVPQAELEEDNSREHSK
jgi:hypothetical protein